MGSGGRGRAIFRHRLWQLLLGIGLISSFLGIVVDTCIGLARDWRHGLLETTDSFVLRLGVMERYRDVSCRTAHAI